MSPKPDVNVALDGFILAVWAAARAPKKGKESLRRAPGAYAPPILLNNFSKLGSDFGTEVLYRNSKPYGLLKTMNLLKNLYVGKN